MQPYFQHCQENIARYDRDRYLISLFASPKARPYIWALFAFNLEIAKTRETVTETQLGLIKLQWWREEITKIYNGEKAPDNAILQGLEDFIKKFSLPQDLFETLIYAREFDLQDVLPADINGMVNYADFTQTPLLKLAMYAHGENEFNADTLRTIAINYALTGLLRATPYHISRRQCFLPEQQLKVAGLENTAHLFDRKIEGDMRAIIAVVVKQLCERIDLTVKPDHKFLKAPQALVKMYLAQIKRADYDVFSPSLLRPPALKELRLLLNAGF